MDSLDLTLRLRPVSSHVPNNDHPAVPENPQAQEITPPISNIPQAFRFRGAATQQYSSGMLAARLALQRSVSATGTRQYRFPLPRDTQEFCVLDISTGKSKVGGSKKRKATENERPAPRATNQDMFCTNINCRVRETPMWRSGPMGPKTLCNACGIKYRKMMLKEQQRGKEIQPQGSSGESSSN